MTQTGTEMEITLTRKQLDKVVEMMTHFKEVDRFTIATDRSSGIGEGVTVSFSLFEEKVADTKIDITDYSKW